MSQVKLVDRLASRAKLQCCNSAVQSCCKAVVPVIRKGKMTKGKLTKAKKAKKAKAKAIAKKLGKVPKELLDKLRARVARFKALLAKYP